MLIQGAYCVTCYSRGRPGFAGMKYLVALVTGRRTKWAVVAVWVVLAGVFAAPGSKLADETNNQTQSFLPTAAESTKVLDLQKTAFAEHQTRDALIVYRRRGGLTGADKRRIARDARRRGPDAARRGTSPSSRSARRAARPGGARRRGRLLRHHVPRQQRQARRLG